MRTGQVFVSHTSDMDQFPADRSFVQAALDAVSRANMAPVDMRYFAARDGKPADYCRQRVRECDVYVAVIGFRYGSMVPGQAASYTELEFDEASIAGLPRLVFLLDKPAGLSARLTDADRGAVEGFRQRLRSAGLVVRAFTSADALELEVFHALIEVTAGRTGASSDGGSAVPGLGELLFSARIKDPDGPLTVGFGASESLGAGRTLASNQRADLIGPSRHLAARRLVAAVQRLLRRPSLPIAEPSVPFLPSGIPVAAPASTCTWIVDTSPHLWLRSGPGFDYLTVDRLYYRQRAYGNYEGVESGGTTWYLLRRNGGGWAWGNSEYLQPIREP
jgi:hypothetical protein